MPSIYLKKTLELVSVPSGLVFVFLMVGFILLPLRKHRGWGQFAVFLALATYYFFGIGPVVNLLLRPLETRYQSPEIKELSQADTVVVLTSYIAPDKRSFLDRLDCESLARLIYALKLHQRLDHLELIFVGAGHIVDNDSPGAQVMAWVAEELGVPRDKIRYIEGPQDTAETAKTMASILSERRFILLTSAVHMPRSVYLFKREGLNPIPYPCHYLAGGGKLSPFSFFPHPANLARADLAVHEYLGLAWYYTQDHFFTKVPYLRDFLGAE
ncbi:YdcF family protein [Thermosulfuriphilus sp.]